ncbi:MAG: hypothetical protein K0R31_1629 [Clostridiales bacterium]|jgi:aspartate 1-decarboxylase|nr:hypothetical protein [Clostridiales bacterium]
MSNSNKIHKKKVKNMRVRKSIVSFIMIMSLVLSLLSPIASAADISANDKAKVLNTLSIVQGDGTGYNLGGVLKRLEAAVLIVRFIGMESNVLSNKDTYKNTKFSDVKSSDWYAPYLGYTAEQNIINGYPDGKFWPNDTITEKSFLKLILGALNYREGSDFTWDNIYQTAYSIGLVNEEGYKNKTQDDIAFSREQVVKILYNSLSVKKKGSNLTVIQNMISEGRISKESAQAAGLISEDVTTSIEAISAPGSDNITIKLNENLKEIAAENIQIYESSNGLRILTFTIKSQTGNEIILNTALQTPDKEYTVTILNAVDMQGNLVNQLSGKFTGFRNSSAQSEFFAVSEVEPLSKNMINVYFTQPVNSNSELPYYYSILKGDEVFVVGSFKTLQVKGTNSNNNAVTLYLKDGALEDNATYTLKISGNLYSKYGAPLQEGSGDSIKFAGRSNETSNLKVVDIDVVDSGTIQVEFNREVDKYYADQSLNYLLTDSNGNNVAINKTVTSGDGLKKGKIVRIGLTKSIEKSTAYNMFLKYIPDNFNYSVIKDEKHNFVASYDSTQNLYIIKSQILDRGTIEVLFNRPLDISTVYNTANYKIRGITEFGYDVNPAKVYYEPEKNDKLIKLYLPQEKLLNKQMIYDVQVLNGLKDDVGNVSSGGMTYNFKNESTDYTKPKIKKATIVSGEIIKVEFDREISKELTNISPDNYTLQYSIDGLSVSEKPQFAGYIDSTTMILKFGKLDMKTKYTLKFDTLVDFAGNNVRTAANGENSISVSSDM